MRWLQKNQAHLIVVERARLENNAKRFRWPDKTVILGAILVTWFAFWVFSIVLMSAKSLFQRDTAMSIDGDLGHDHEDIKQKSPILRGLKRHRVGACYFRAQEQPEYGFLSSPCSLSNTCAFRDTIQEARDACLTHDQCTGVTFVPWEERYELRDGNDIVESFDGQISSLKLCDDRRQAAAGDLLDADTNVT
jgi:hypothetical protein